MASIPLHLEGLSVNERRSATECWTLSPNPSVIYWNEEWSFVACCDCCNREVIGRWSFLDQQGNVLLRGFLLSDRDPCAAFRATVPVGAVSLCITILCVDIGEDPTACEDTVCITCQRAPEGMAKRLTSTGTT